MLEVVGVGGEEVDYWVREAGYSISGLLFST